MDRNLILAIVLSVIIIVAFQYFFQSFSPPPQRQPATKPEITAPQIPPKLELSGEPSEKEIPRIVQEALPEGLPKPPEKEITITVNSPKFEAILSSRGAKLISFKLKDYKETLESNELVNLFNSGGLDTSGPSIMFVRRDETFTDSLLNYSTDSPSQISVQEKGEKKTITFAAAAPGGLEIIKSYTFHAGKYEVDFSFTLSNRSDESKNYLITFPWKKVYKTGENSRFTWDSAEILLNGELKDYAFKDIKGEEEPSGRIEWAGLGDVYFFRALVFGEKPAHKVSLLKPTKEGLAEIRVRYGSIDVPAGQSVKTDLSLYIGPKEREALREAGNNLSKALVYSYYGVLDIMSRYLVIFLRFMNSGFEVAGIRFPGTHNYGLDIIILTIIIKILFIPLTHKSMKSMKRMQDIQPQIAKLREKYKDDKAALNKATMELFREQKVNPLGGCWPMFLQLPVFIALYQALSYAIELRHAPFMCFPSIYLCINDLSAPDPYYVTPILMGGTMVLQQWLTPSGGDPTQRKMMLLMPIVFTYLFLTFPSGLVLYWLINNVLSIAQQVITNKMAK